jgi:adenylate cyclase
VAERPTRKLAVILHADVVGSTALVRLDETLAHQRIRDAFQRFSEIIISHSGIAHEIRGDALVAEFARVSDAVGASLAFQVANSAHNENLSDDIRPFVRVGIAMGEVVVADGTLTGEGVVLAQRLEQLADPGGVCIQGAAYETLPKRLPFEYENLGERQVKGFEQPVRVYAVSLKPGGAIPEPETPARLDSAALDLPDKPSIAVLPFANMSGDSEQEYFSDGISEDLTTALSHFDWLFVIARNSAFTYKGKAVDVKQVGRELGVRYVLEGSVRRAGDRVRVNAQLIDADADGHVWAERFDRQMVDVFELQDDIVASIASTVAPEIKH